MNFIKNNQFRKRNNLGKCIFLLFCLKKDKICFKMNYFSFNEKYTRVGF